MVVNELFGFGIPLMASGSKYPVVMIKSFDISRGGGWIVYFKEEAGMVAMYDGRHATLEGAIDLFIRHRINGEPQTNERKIW